MSFWKRSEDPWDIDPEKRRREPVNVFESELEETPAEEKKWPWQKKEAPGVILETCPWCGKLMERGYLFSGRDKLRLSEEKPSAFWGTMGMDTIEFCDEGFLVTHRSCWQCKVCRKVVADFPEPVEYAAEGNLPDWTAVPVTQFDADNTKEREE